MCVYVTVCASVCVDVTLCCLCVSVYMSLCVCMCVCVADQGKGIQIEDDTFTTAPCWGKNPEVGVTQLGAGGDPW